MTKTNTILAVGIVIIIALISTAFMYSTNDSVVHTNVLGGEETEVSEEVEAPTLEELESIEDEMIELY